jgi:hypothetical protein
MSFSQKAFNENDERAKNKVKEMFKSRFQIEDNTDRYGIDLIFKREGRIRYYVEVEVKNLWSGQTFPWDEINVPARKEKYFNVYTNSMYIMFNTDLTSCFVISGKTILESPKKEVSNTRNLTGEYFFKVPYTKVIHHRNI